MDSTKDHLEQRQVEGTGISSDLRRLTKEGAASAEEMRAFLGHLRGRSPQEVLGVVAQSDLVRSIAVATVGCIVLLAVTTLVPYALKDKSATVTKKAAPAAVGTDDASPETSAAEPTPADTASGDGQPNLERAADAMGISGSEDADPKSNPLDKLDNLLDGVD